MIEVAQDHGPHPIPEKCPASYGLLIGCFTGIYPITVHVNGLWQIGNGSLELLQADCAGYDASISASLHFNITWFLVVAERTGELRVQVSRHLLLRRRLSFGLTSTHCPQTTATKRQWKKTKNTSMRWVNTAIENPREQLMREQLPSTVVARYCWHPKLAG